MSETVNRHLIHWPRVPAFSVGSFAGGAKFLKGWQKRRTKVASIPISTAAIALEAMVTAYIWQVDLPVEMLLGGLFAVTGSFVSLLATIRAAEPLKFVWWPLYFALWLATLVEINYTGGLTSPLLFPLLALYFVLGVVVQNAIPVWGVLAFTAANLAAWAATRDGALLGPSVVLPIFVLIGICFALFLPLHSEAALAEEVVKATNALAEARVALARTAEVNEAKGAFLAAMSHEMRTPLAAVLGLVDLALSSDLSPSEREEYAELVRRNGDHLVALVKDILDYADIETQRFVVRKATVSLRDLLGEFADHWRPLAEGKGLGFFVRIGDELPQVIATDRVLARRVLDQLAANALRFTAKGRIGVEVVESAATANGRRGLEFLVSDTGSGIDAQDAERIFRPFSQGDESLTRTHGGAGLGLTIARSVAKLLDGNLRLVRSAVGEGSVFGFFLPQ